MLFGTVCYAVSMKHEVATKQEVQGSDIPDKYTITYREDALRFLEDLTEQYGFASKDTTLQFALIAISRLKKEGMIGLRDI